MSAITKNIEKFAKTLIISYEEFNKLALNYKLKTDNTDKNIYLHQKEEKLYGVMYKDYKCSHLYILTSYIMAYDENIKTLEDFQEYIINTYLI